MFLTTKHKQNCLAALQATAAGASIENNNAITGMPAIAITMLAKASKEVILASLGQDLIALKLHTDVLKKIELKKSQLIPKWKVIVDDYIASGAAGYYEPLVRLVIWMLDAEQISDAIKYADVAIQKQQPMPEGFKRDLATFTAETVHDWAVRQLEAGHSAEPYFSYVVASVESNQWLVTEPIALNRIYKLAGIFAEKVPDLKKAEQYYLKCVEVNPEKHGVKTRLAVVQTKLGAA